MTEQTARELLIDYLYNEISEADKQKLKTYLSNHPELQQELKELRETQSLLQQMPDIDPKQKLAIVEPGKRSFSDWCQDAKIVLPQSWWGKAALATAAWCCYS